MYEPSEQSIREQLRRLLVGPEETRGYKPRGKGSPPPQPPTTPAGVGVDQILENQKTETAPEGHGPEE